MRFTEQAQQTLKLAQEEARNLNHNWVGTEHLLLGLVRLLYESGPHGLPALRRVMSTVTPDSVRALVLQAVAPNSASPSEDLPINGRNPEFTARMNLVMEDSWQISLDLGNDHLGNEHLLLGALYEKDGVAAQVLHELGVTYEAVYESIAFGSDTVSTEGPEVDTQPGPLLLPPDSTRMTPGAVRMSEFARQQAGEDELTNGMLGTHHYLLAMMMEGISDPEGSLAAAVLNSFGITYGALESRIEELSISNTSDAPNWDTAPPASSARP